jgi:hypothetical protein
MGLAVILTQSHKYREFHFIWEVYWSISSLGLCFEEEFLWFNWSGQHGRRKSSQMDFIYHLNFLVTFLHDTECQVIILTHLFFLECYWRKSTVANKNVGSDTSLGRSDSRCSLCLIRFQVLPAACMNLAVYWIVCSVQCLRILQTFRTCLLLPSSGRLVRCHDGTSKHVWNVGKPLSDKAQQHRREAS